MSATLNSRALESFAVDAMRLHDTGTPESARFMSDMRSITIVDGRRAKTDFRIDTILQSAKPIRGGRDERYADALAIVGTGRDAVAQSFSLKCTTRKARPVDSSVDVGCNKSGEATYDNAQDSALFVIEVWGTGGVWPEGSAGLVTGVSVLGCRFHRIDGALKGADVPYLMSEAAEKAMHRMPTDASTIEDTDGHGAWWRAQDSYWRLRVRLNDSTAISGWMEAEEAGKFALALATTHGRKAPQRNAASHRLDNLSFWKKSGAVKTVGMKSEDAIVLNARLAGLMADLMDGKWHHVADLQSNHKGVRVNVKTLKAQIERLGWTIENLRPSAERKVTGEHGYRLARG